MTLAQIRPILEMRDKLFGRTSNDDAGYGSLSNVRRTATAVDTTRPMHWGNDYDRPNALLAIVTTSPLPTATAIINGAAALLGHLLRDVALLADMLQRTPPGQGDVRRALVEAMDMLGVIADVHLAIPCGYGRPDVESYIVALRLAELKSDRFREAVESLAEKFESEAAIAATDRAIMRLDLDRPLSVVD